MVSPTKVSEITTPLEIKKYISKNKRNGVIIEYLNCSRKKLFRLSININSFSGEVIKGYTSIHRKISNIKIYKHSKEINNILEKIIQNKNWEC